MKKPVYIAQVPINPLDYADVLSHVEKAIDQKQKLHIVTVNPEMILNAQEDDAFYSILMKSSINTADGIGVLWASYYLSLPKRRGLAGFWQLMVSLVYIILRPSKIRSIIPDRVTGADLLTHIVDSAQSKKWRIFFLGAAPGVAKAAMRSLKKQYPQAELVDCFSGDPLPESEDEICRRIHLSKANIIFIAYGSPQQEYWIHRNLFKLSNVNVAIGIGGAFDFYANKIKRAPAFFRLLGLEWLWRLFMQPSRAERIKNATYRFIRLIYNINI